MNQGEGISFWIPLSLLLLSITIWLWTALRRYHANRDELSQLQTRLRQRLLDSLPKFSEQNTLLTEKIKRLTDEANELLHRLIDKNDANLEQPKNKIDSNDEQG